jgi:MFS family permease
MSEGRQESLPNEAVPLVRRDGRLITDSELRRGMRVNMIAGALGTMWFTVVAGIPATLFLKCIGATGVVIGLSATVQQLAMLCQIPAALLAERLPTRKAYWAPLAIGQRLLWFVPAAIPLLMARGPAMAYAVVTVMALSALLAQAATPPWWSWMADLIPEPYRATFWGRRQRFVMMANLGMLLLSGWLLDGFPDPTHPGGSFFGYTLLFALAAALGTADIVVHLGVPEPRPGPAHPEAGLVRRLLAPLRSRDFLWLTVAIGMWNFGVGLIAQFSALYMTREFAASYTALSMAQVCSAIGIIAAGFVWPYVMERIAARNLGAIMIVVAPLAGVVWFLMRDVRWAFVVPVLGRVSLQQPVVLLCGANLVAGMLYSAVGLVQVNLLGALAPLRGRTVAMAMHWSVVGLLAALGPLLAGRVMDWFTQHPLDWVLPTGTRVTFFQFLVLGQIALCWGVAMPLMLRVRLRAGELPLRTALARIPFGSPMRMIGQIYNIYTVLAASTSHERATAVCRLGERRTSIAVRDLVARLDDPSATVREEAALALGHIGSPDAVDALLHKLEDPETDLGPHIVRALRRARSPRSVEALLRRLADPDREMVSETARTLGELGDARAGYPLLELLRQSRDSKVVSSSSEALARLGELGAVYEILPRMHSASNPVLRRSLAVALADLIGAPGEFYGVLTRAERERGAEYERLVGDLSRAAAALGAARASSADARAMRERGEALRRLADTGRAADLAEPLFRLFAEAARLHYGLRGQPDAEALTEVLVWRNTRLGTVLWFLDSVREQPPAGRDDTGMLLALYLAAHWTGHMARGTV